MSAKSRYKITDPPLPADVSCRMEQRMLPMRDGTKLFTSVVFPLKEKKNGKYPVVYVRTPYLQKTQFDLPDCDVLKHNCVYICQACRGTGWSEGKFIPAERRTEEFDAEDTLNWLQKQPWFSGRCAMYGASYPGWVQWCAARTGHPALVSIAPRVAPLYSCVGAAMPGGVARLSFALHWPITMYHRCTYGYGGVPDYDKLGICYHLPVLDCDRFCGYPEIPEVRKFLLVAREPGRQLTGFRKEFEKIRVPAYISGSFFDGFLQESVESFQLMRTVAATPEARRFTRMILGPWGHGDILNPELFGAKNDLTISVKRQQKFTFRSLRAPKADPLPEEPVVRYFLMGENRWCGAECWPPAGVKNSALYLHSSEGANSDSGDGRLDAHAPAGAEKTDVFVGDPGHPVLSNAGTHESLGCYDRSAMEKRGDVLVYSTRPFDKPFRVTGESKLHFYARCSTPDADFAAILTDLTPEGKSLFLCVGMIRARFRKGLDREVPLEPGKTEEFEITLPPTANTFLPGHALRLELCAHYFPACDRNLNTGAPFGEGSEMRSSVQCVLHDKEHPARLTLPVLEGKPGFLD